jgi:F1F0 ATPase subunit 2
VNQVIFLFLAFLAGLALGLVYFGGLWLTVQRLPTSRRPGLLAALSLFLRLGFVLGGFYLVMGGRWQRLLACLGGFLLLRALSVRRLGPRVKSPTPKGQG